MSIFPLPWCGPVTKSWVEFIIKKLKNTTKNIFKFINKSSFQNVHEEEKHFIPENSQNGRFNDHQHIKPVRRIQPNDIRAPKDGRKQTRLALVLPGQLVPRPERDGAEHSGQPRTLPLRQHAIRYAERHHFRHHSPRSGETIRVELLLHDSG